MTKLGLGILFATSLTALCGLALALVIVLRVPSPAVPSCQELRVRLDSVEQQVALAQWYVLKRGSQGGP